METVEMTIMLVIAIIVSGMIITFLTQFDFEGIRRAINSLLSPKPDLVKVREMKSSKFPGLVYECWKQCEFGAFDSNCTSAYVTPSDPTNTSLDANYFQALFAKMNFCSNCNVTVNGGTVQQIKLPSIIAIECFNGTINLRA